MKNARRGKSADTAAAEVSFFTFDSSMLERRDIAAYIYSFSWSHFFQAVPNRGAIIRNAPSAQSAQRVPIQRWGCAYLFRVPKVPVTIKETEKHADK
jgi:hypothetical protein